MCIPQVWCEQFKWNYESHQLSWQHARYKLVQTLSCTLYLVIVAIAWLCSSSAWRIRSCRYLQLFRYNIRWTTPKSHTHQFSLAFSEYFSFVKVQISKRQCPIYRISSPVYNRISKLDARQLIITFIALQNAVNEQRQLWREAQQNARISSQQQPHHYNAFHQCITQ